MHLQQNVTGNLLRSQEKICSQRLSLQQSLPLEYGALPRASMELRVLVFDSERCRGTYNHIRFCRLSLPHVHDIIAVV